MKTFFISLFFLVTCSVFAQTDCDRLLLIDNHPHIPPDSARYFEGSIATICGKVLSTEISKSGAVYIHFGESIFNIPFTAIVFRAHLDIFNKDKPYDFYKGKSVCITGRIQMYATKPAIVIHSAEQIREQ